MYGKETVIQVIYTEMTKKALILSFEAHKNQVDKSGIPYVYHPFHLAEQMNTEEETIAALLHDVVEDTHFSIEDIKAEGFADNIVEALSLLTHDESIPYMDYVAKIKHNRIAKAVKLADLRHNSDLSRLETVDVKAIKRVQKYAEAVKLLLGKDAVVNNLKFSCYSDGSVYLGGTVKNGCLNIESEVCGDSYSSEKYYSFSKKETEKLFSLMTLQELIEMCKRVHVLGMEKFFEENDIRYESSAV